MATNAIDGLDDRTLLYSQLDAYPWDEDQEFQGGLRAILGSVQNPEQVEHLTLRAKCYYYARKAGTQVDFDGYKQHVQESRDVANGSGHVDLASGLDPAATDVSAGAFNTGSAVNEEGGMGGMADAPKPASFAEICEMIAEGKPIPGIKDIPDTILEGQKTESRKELRKKPWEKDSAAADEVPSWMSGRS